MRTDGREFLADADVIAAIHHLPVPGILLYAERGLMNEAPGLYGGPSLESLEVPARLVPDTNHYSIMMSDKGARAVADEIVRFSRRPG